MMNKKWDYLNVEKEKVEQMQKMLNIHPAFCKMLVQREINSYDAAAQFFQPDLDQLHDPFLMKGMDKAVDRLLRALDQQESILLYGDYDVDGTSSVAMMYCFLENKSRKIDYYIPDRYKEGYGISMAGIDYARQNGVNLIIAMDCGIKAIDPIDLANSYGIDVIICDHHTPGEVLPKAFAILDPKQANCAYPYKELSGCGISFKMIQGILEKQKSDPLIAYSYLDYLVISIACDIVPLTGENRILAYFGLRRLKTSKRPGLLALIQKAKLSGDLSISDVVFGIGPLINAAGRLADAQAAVNVLLAKNQIVANEQAKILEERNKLRKEFDQRMVQEAKDLWKMETDMETRKSIVLYQSNWHKGLVGIVAARLVDEYYRPTVILTESAGVAVGSARSIKGFDIYEALQACSDLLENFGGHPYAAGLTLKLDRAEAFKNRFEEVVSAKIMEEQLIPRLSITAELQLAEVNFEFWNMLKRFAPFGPGNHRPIFISKNLKDSGHSKVLRDKHLRIAASQGDSTPMVGIGFGQGMMLDLVQEEAFDLCYTIQENVWKNSKSIQLNVRDIRKAE